MLRKRAILEDREFHQGVKFECIKVSSIGVEMMADSKTNRTFISAFITLKTIYSYECHRICHVVLIIAICHFHTFARRL